jgi:hypothetical protein
LDRLFGYRAANPGLHCGPFRASIPRIRFLAFGFLFDSRSIILRLGRLEEDYNAVDYFRREALCGGLVMLTPADMVPLTAESLLIANSSTIACRQAGV